ncbi:xanthine dehydrogenase family protein molybdopterin-binding subunit [Sphingomonas sp.]|uniref:xanthine dehydrogenase family protein molybdopterin-binding subunit n=1 Tax=Sphingomonas sp. TaxID=28214 RepID=UPI003CC65D95
MAELMMDAPYRPAALDRPKGFGGQGVLGLGIDRVDGPAKVTGDAQYAVERPPANCVYGSVVGAPVGSGRVVRIDAAAAEALPGVVAVIHGDPRIPAGGSNSQKLSAQGDTRIFHLGQPVALVVAETAEIAREAARLVSVTVDETPGRYDAAAETPVSDHGIGFLPAIAKGDLDAALAAAPVTLDLTYRTPIHFPAALEPHGTTAWWEGDKLTLRSSNQVIGAGRATVAKALGIEPDRVRMLAPFVGGGFGGKTGVQPEAILAAIAAEKLGRPVKISVPRAQIAYLAHHRSDTVQRIRLAAEADGRLTAIAHESVAAQNDDSAFLEPVPFGTLPLYRGEVRHFRTDVVRVDLPPTGAVRAPGEAIGSFAVEGAMDELAERLGLDPLELRRRNEPEVDPLSGKPFSTRFLMACYAEGAKRFGWPEARPAPGSRREGEWLIGVGLAASLRGNFTVNAQARVRIEPDGTATVECDMTDIGTGTYTILAQVAGEMLGLPVAQVDVRLGDTDLPPTAGSGGSFGAGSSASAVALACEDLLVELGRRMNAAPDELVLQDGRVRAGDREATLSELTRGAPITAHGKTGPGKASRATSQASHGAQFAEVAVNAVTGEVRVRRMVGVFDIGRVLNEKTARSQILGGMIWGISYALMEHAVIDPRTGAFVTPDFGEYHVAVSADAPAIEIAFVGEVDDHANPIGAKGVGELGISGAGAAVMNAIYNACGVRVYDLPITPDKLLAGLPDV